LFYTGVDSVVLTVGTDIVWVKIEIKNDTEAVSKVDIDDVQLTIGSAPSRYQSTDGIIDVLKGDVRHEEILNYYDRGLAGVGLPICGFSIDVPGGTTSFDVYPGSARSFDDLALICMPTMWTVDINFVGVNGRDTSDPIASDTWYAVYVIQGDDHAAIVCSKRINPTEVVLPTGYYHLRCIGFVKTGVGTTSLVGMKTLVFAGNKRVTYLNSDVELFNAYVSKDVWYDLDCSYVAPTTKTIGETTEFNILPLISANVSCPTPVYLTFSKETTGQPQFSTYQAGSAGYEHATVNIELPCTYEMHAKFKTSHPTETPTPVVNIRGWGFVHYA